MDVDVNKSVSAQQRIKMEVFAYHFVGHYD